ncbi:Uncharacterised protein [Mycobacteroides abscessus subsp. abscessus]|uniref:hypothetical protein n=1 Tax=Mycobacteroides abscessus TaxID=36809 RepID=UPI00092B9F9A|nr:hypothetical protein [Mycobacteroides abscessus]SHR98798.1 Uncharacterised protein [Mycobacteroides abscessus subsp. abscessus]
MGEKDADVARYRHAAEQLAWEAYRPPMRSVVYIGAVAAAMRNIHLTGNGGGYTFTDSLMETLIGDPLGVQASAELGPIDSLRNERWVSGMWPQIEARVAEAPTPRPTTAERFHRRAAVELTLDRIRFEGEVSTAAVVAYVDVMAAARTRWHLGEFDLVEGMDPLALIGDVVASEPVAAAADAELDAGWKRTAAKVMSEHWDEIREKAADLEATAAIAAAVVGPEQRVEAARRSARQYLRGRGLDGPGHRNIVAYAGAAAEGHARWLEAGALPEQRELFEVQGPDLDPNSAADQVGAPLRDRTRQMIATRWDEIVGELA